MNPQIIEFYRQLDLEPGADLVSIRQSYRQLVKVWHPDRFGNDEKLQAAANNKLKKINFDCESLIAFLESGGKVESAPPPKAEAPSKNTKSSAAEGIENYLVI